MKKNSKADVLKVRYRKCEGCGQRTEMKLLYRIRDRDICLSCGHKEIAEWNRFVREGEAQS